jgi:hypothetical protein
MKRSARIDAKVEKLVRHVQSYSDPTGIPPSTPTEEISEPPSLEERPGAESGPDRLTRPEWFEPITDALDRQQDDRGDVPAINDPIQIPDVSSAEEQNISSAGVEALAYYAPFHFYQPHQWGIYIRDFGIAYLACRFLGRNVLTPADNWVLRSAYEFLLQHEYSHFQVEVAVSRYELLLFQKTIYLAHVYLHHFADRHSSWLEESIANARAYQEFEHKTKPTTSPHAIPQFKSFLAQWMKSQPPGYRDYDRWKGRAGFKRGRLALTTQLHDGLRRWRRGAIDNSADILDLFREADYSKVRTIRIADTRLAGLGSAP